MYLIFDRIILDMKIDNNLVVVVTGGSSGLGEATVKLLASLGAKVVIADINEQLGQALAKQVNAVFFKVNVTNEENVKQLFEFTRKTYGRVDAVVHCAGVLSMGLIINNEGVVAPTSQMDRVLNINVVGTFNVSKYAAKVMSQQPEINSERGAIILISSVAQQEGVRGQVVYSASKGAVMGMVLPMARDLSKYKIRVMGIAPGLFQTPMGGLIPKKFMDIMVNQVPLERQGHPQEFAQLCQTIIENPYATGSVWRIDGGGRLPYF